MRTNTTNSLRGWRVIALLLAVLALVAVSCGNDDDSRGSQTTITLAVNPWNGSAANVAVAAQLLESELGYTV